MLALDDPRWLTYSGGYGTVYDASVPLRRLLKPGSKKKVWKELWEELHHQGDVGNAAYAAVPYLLEFARQSPKLDWNVFGLISTIEEARPTNPPPAPEVADAYFRAVASIPEVVGNHPDHAWDAELTQSVVACIALARGQRTLARAYGEMSLEQAQTWLSDEFGDEFD